MQQKDAYKTRYQNSSDGSNGVGSNPTPKDGSVYLNPPCEEFSQTSEYNDLSSATLKKRVVSYSAFKKAIQLVIAIFGSALVGFGLIFSSATSEFKAEIDVNVYPQSVIITLDVVNAQEEVVEGDFEILCQSRHTTAYSQSYSFPQLDVCKEYCFEELLPNTSYVIKLYKDGKLIDKCAFKTDKE